MSIYDIDLTPEPEYLDQSMWEEMTIAEQIAYLDRAWEDKMDQYAPRDCDEADWGHPGELDQADYYTSGDLIPW